MYDTLPKGETTRTGLRPLPFQENKFDSPRHGELATYAIDGREFLSHFSSYIALILSAIFLRQWFLCFSVSGGKCRSSPLRGVVGSAVIMYNTRILAPRLV
ncbi:hypothetical protein M426DRAFT_326300 [Hypoxylon sp. CI-4A]|nr:hypothetical protein M426DRAFT_326300 [Hypoxylon sp. CI-4A]